MSDFDSVLKEWSVQTWGSPEKWWAPCEGHHYSSVSVHPRVLHNLSTLAPQQEILAVSECTGLSKAFQHSDSPKIRTKDSLLEHYIVERRPIGLHRFLSYYEKIHCILFHKEESLGAPASLRNSRNIKEQHSNLYQPLGQGRQTRGMKEANGFIAWESFIS